MFNEFDMNKLRAKKQVEALFKIAQVLGEVERMRRKKIEDLVKEIRNFNSKKGNRKKRKKFKKFNSKKRKKLGQVRVRVYVIKKKNGDIKIYIKGRIKLKNFNSRKGIETIILDDDIIKQIVQDVLLNTVLKNKK